MATKKPMPKSLKSNSKAKITSVNSASIKIQNINICESKKSGTKLRSRLRNQVFDFYKTRNRKKTSFYEALDLYVFNSNYFFPNCGEFYMISIKDITY